ncbi:hypothetical protein BHE74_00019655 [Ensete ventricosum]|nr:hypothetical protein BHE74_00019655 [Ensete ventricosum]
MASVDLIGVKLEAFEMRMEDKLCALFVEFRLGQSPSSRRSQCGESPDRKKNQLEKEEQATDSLYPCILPSMGRWRPNRVDFTRRAVLPLSQDPGGFYAGDHMRSQDDVVGSRRSSLGDSSKGSGSSLGTHWEIAGKRLEDSSQEGHRLPDWRDIKAAFLLPLLPSLSPPPIQEIPTIVSRQVKARQPYTLMAAIAFARLQEERLNHEARKIRVTPRPAMPKPSAPSTAI